METFRRLLDLSRRWLEGHWRPCMAALLLVIVMQQCTISRLWSVVDPEVRQREAPATPTSHVTPAPADSDSLALAPIDADGQQQTRPGDHEPSTPWLSYIVVLAAAAILAYVYLRRRGVYPFGVTLTAALARPDSQHLTLSVTVANRSRRAIEVADPMVCFRGAGDRKFRTALSDLPMTLAPGTAFQADLQLQPLMERNNELLQCSAVAASLLIDNKRRRSAFKALA